VLGKPRELRVWTGAGKDLGIALGKGTPALSLERMGDDRRPAALGTGVDDPIDEVDKLVWKSNSDLLAHPKMVAKRYQTTPQTPSVARPLQDITFRPWRSWSKRPTGLPLRP
jgi:hypothetical protein